ncbi:MAG: extracellular solute-binding protein [Pseudomonadota bacterium]
MYIAKRAAKWSALSAMILSTAVSANAADLTISVWGGTYGEKWAADVVEPFEEATGLDVALDLGRSGERLAKLMATGGQGIDLIFLTDHQMAIAKGRGFLEPVDATQIPNMENLHDFAVDPLGEGMCPAITLLGVGLVYNKEMFETPPTSWLVLEEEGLPAPPAFMDMAFSVAPSVLTRLAELKGGSLDDPDPAFEMMESRKDEARVFTLFEVIDWINRDEVSVAPMLNIFARKDDDLAMRFTFPEDGTLGVVNLACVVKGSPNTEAAHKFLDYYLSAEVQAKQAEVAGETPVVKDVALPTDSPYTFVPADSIDELIVYDPNAIAQKRGEWMERFQDDIATR